jgi:hypothetical protein
MVPATGFELPRRRMPTNKQPPRVDVQGGSDGRVLENWCRLQDSNPWPPDYKSGALPTELSRRILVDAPLASNHAKGPALCLRNMRCHFFGAPKRF